MVGAHEYDGDGPQSGAIYFCSLCTDSIVYERENPGPNRSYHHFGVSLESDNQHLFVGANDKAGDAMGGLVYVYTTSHDEQLQFHDPMILAPKNQSYEERFGESISVDGDWLVIGAPYKGQYSGTAYVFHKESTNWEQYSTLSHPSVDADDYFGTSVAIFGNTIVIGAPGNETERDSTRSGSIYIFNLDNNNVWKTEGAIFPSDSLAGSWFGQRVAIKDSLIVVSALSDNSFGEESGSIYPFLFTDNDWQQLDKLTMPGQSAGDHFGISIALDKNMIIVGANGEERLGKENAGSITFLKRSGKDIEYVAKFSPENLKEKSYFGSSIDIKDSVAIVGAPGINQAFLIRSDMWGAGMLEITLPNSQTIWHKNKAQTIIWNDDIFSNVSIELFNGDSEVRTIAEETESDGTFEWAIPEEIADGDRYKIKITSSYNNEIYDTSEEFTIRGYDSVKVVQPNGGEKWRQGFSEVIKWEDNFEDSVKIELYNNETFIKSIADQTESDGLYVWQIDTDLDANISYKIKIISANNEDVYDFSDNPFELFKVSPTCTTKNVSDIKINSVQLHGDVDSKNYATEVWFEYGKNPEPTDWDAVMVEQSPIQQTDTTSIDVLLDSLDEDSLYYYRIAAKNQGGAINGNIKSFRTYTDEIAIDCTIEFPYYDRKSAYSEHDYRQIGFPGNSEFDLATVIGDEHGANWVAFWDNGKPGPEKDNYLVEYGDSLSIFILSTGKAFWLLHKDDLSISRSFSPINLENDAANIPIHHGWNLITNPFIHAVDWAQIKSINGNATLSFYHDDTYHYSDIMLPCQGYYLYNTDLSRQELIIPYSSTFPQLSNYQKTCSLAWGIEILIFSNSRLKDRIEIGSSNLALKGKDDMDYYKPRNIFGDASVQFERPEWDDYYHLFSRDIRPQPDEFEEWIFTARNIRSKKTKLEIKGLENVPDNWFLYLHDIQNEYHVNLRERSTYDIKTTEDFANFKFIMSETQIDLSGFDKNIPDKMSIHHNYPNPFNSDTIIPISISRQVKIELSIYNLLGRKISSLHDGFIEPGFYEFKWDGKNKYGEQQSSGVYMYKLTIENEEELVRKMIFIK